MNKTLAVMLMATTLMSGTTFADEGLDLAKDKQCLSCHAVDTESIGPSFRSIAHKYIGQPKTEGMLVSQITKGSPDHGGYHWGTLKMPTPGPRPAVSEAEAKELLEWIMNRE